MRVLIVGGGGREHAMARALRTARGIELLTAPGNPGTALLGRNAAVAADDVPGLVRLAQTERIELVVPGPEAPLAAGLADALPTDVLCCGPSRAAARLESSKEFTRTLAATLGVPGPAHRIVRAPAEITPALRAFAAPPVVKADGLCGGKGVSLPGSFAECSAQIRRLLDGALGPAGERVVLEERLLGTEASLFFACHGEQLVALPHARDHKRLLDGDRGPNTGGMGAISPSPDLAEAQVAEVGRRIVRPILRALATNEPAAPFVGFLFVGLMLTAAGPRLLELNVRLGDPEAQAVLPRLCDGEFLRLCLATARGRLDGFTLALDPRPTCAVVVAAPGYPESVRCGAPVHLGPRLETRDRWFLHAGTRRAPTDGALEVGGGRVGTVLARGPTAAAARARTYAGLPHVRFAGRQVRSDIG